MAEVGSEHVLIGGITVGAGGKPCARSCGETPRACHCLGQRVRIVPRGALVASKFHAAVSPRRAIGDKYQDIADISRIIAKRFDSTDEALEVATHAFDGASNELATLIDDRRHGRAVKI